MSPRFWKLNKTLQELIPCQIESKVESFACYMPKWYILCNLIPMLCYGYMHHNNNISLFVKELYLSAAPDSMFGACSEREDCCNRMCIELYCLDGCYLMSRSALEETTWCVCGTKSPVEVVGMLATVACHCYISTLVQLIWDNSPERYIVYLSWQWRRSLSPGLHQII